MFERLLKLANYLDLHGFFKEADQIDEIMREATFSPEEYKKYYGREMEPERLKEWEDEQTKEEPIEVKMVQPKSIQIPELSPAEEMIVYQLTGFDSIRKLDYDMCIQLYKDLVEEAMLGRRHPHPSLFSLAKKVQRYAENFGDFNPRDFQ